MALQSAVLGLGAYLVIKEEATAGIIIASSVLTARALAPVDQVIANWKGFVATRQSWTRLNELLARLTPAVQPLPLPRPTATFSVEGVSVAPPASRSLVVYDVSFALKSGQALAVIGPTASGKSSLARAIVGAWEPARGSIRLDGAALDQWSPTQLGRHVGYMPQEVELLAGTVAQNIARFDPQAASDDVIAAAKAADLHELILNLPNGYDTLVGSGGATLAAGQRQRIALARALFGNPFLVVLDEPNSNLDSDGEEALRKAILGVRSRSGIVVVVAHRPGVLAAVDMVLAMGQGRALAFGPKDEVLNKIMRRPVAPTPAIRIAETPGARG
jgi:ATP-binding cassette subfamily C protein